MLSDVDLIGAVEQVGMASAGGFDPELDAAMRASLQDADTNDPLVTAVMELGFDRNLAQQAVAATTREGAQQVNNCQLFTLPTAIIYCPLPTAVYSLLTIKQPITDCPLPTAVYSLLAAKQPIT